MLKQILKRCGRGGCWRRGTETRTEMWGAAGLRMFGSSELEYRCCPEHASEWDKRYRSPIEPHERPEDPEAVLHNPLGIGPFEEIQAIDVEALEPTGTGRVRDVVTVAFGRRWRPPFSGSHRLAREARKINERRGR